MVENITRGEYTVLVADEKRAGQAREQETEPPQEAAGTGEMTIQEARQALGVSRERIQEFLREGRIDSRLEIHQGRARRMLDAAGVERLAKQRREDAAAQSGKGRPIKLPD